MKTPAFALAALLALSGTAFAGQTAKTVQAQAPACAKIERAATLDCAATGSIDRQATDSRAAERKGPRLGIDINPWIMPSGF